MTATRPWPVEVVVDRPARRIDILWDDGRRDRLPAELLRVESPSAEVQGHGGDDKQVVAGKAGVGIAGIDPVGHYALRIRFDDGHDTGLFSWETLRRLGTDQDRLFAAYLAALAARGLTRQA